jgi:hypothetical protein
MRRLKGIARSPQSPKSRNVLRTLPNMKKVAVALVVLLVSVAGGWIAIEHRSDTSASLESSKTTKPAVELKKSSFTPPIPPPVMTPSRAEQVPTQQSPATRERQKYADMKLDEMLTPNNGFVDPVFGVSVTYPENWAVRDAKRWGDFNEQNTVWFVAGDSLATPSMYYQLYPEGSPPGAGNVEAYLREVARKKEESRNSRPGSDYKNDPESFVFRELNGNPSLSYFATYTQGDRVMAEYFVRVLGPKGYVMFFTNGPADHVRKIIPTVQQVGGTVKPP